MWIFIFYLSATQENVEVCVHYFVKKGHFYACRKSNAGDDNKRRFLKLSTIATLLKKELNYFLIKCFKWFYCRNIYFTQKGFFFFCSLTFLNIKKLITTRRRNILHLWSQVFREKCYSIVWTVIHISFKSNTKRLNDTFERTFCLSPFL